LTFEKLKLPLTVCATDFVNCKPVYFSDGELVPVLLGSAAMPAFYAPVEYRNMTILEGGLTNNLPIEPLLNRCDVIIASHVNPLNAESKKLSIANVIDRSFHIAVSESLQHKKTMCQLFIEPPALSRFGILDMDEAESIFKVGYEYAIGLKKEVEKLFL
jgi:NTE family protein